MPVQIVTDEEVEIIERIASACQGYLEAKSHAWSRDPQVMASRRQERNSAALEVKHALDDYVDERVRAILKQELEDKGGMLHGLVSAINEIPH